TFCCTCPKLIAQPDGCYPLCYSLVSGLSSLLIAQNGDKAVCGANLQHLICDLRIWLSSLTRLLQPINNKIVTFNMNN
ncbi:MAG: hypothetical protein ABWZ56_06045, partial [Flavobacterium sp.]